MTITKTMGYIYKITNKQSKKCYIGVTGAKNVELRWKGHVRAIMQGKGCPALRDAITKYGIANFTFEILIICFDEDIYKYEPEYIKKYNSQVPNGYNISPGGRGSCGFTGKTHTIEAKQKISEKTKEIQADAEYRKKMSERAKASADGAKTSAALKSSEKWQKAVADGRVGNRGGHLDEKTKEKIAESVKKYYSAESGTEKHRLAVIKALGKAVVQSNPDGVIINTFPTIAEASRRTGVSKGGIQFVLYGQRKKAGGFTWTYAA